MDQKTLHDKIDFLGKVRKLIDGRLLLIYYSVENRVDTWSHLLHYFMIQSALHSMLKRPQQSIEKTTDMQRFHPKSSIKPFRHFVCRPLTSDPENDKRKSAEPLDGRLLMCHNSHRP